MEEEHLRTKASTPYRDPTFNASSKDIILDRVKEQSISELICTNIWRKKWGMTKSTFNS